MIGRLRRRLEDERGITLVELVVGVTLFMILLGAVLSMLDSATRTEREQQARQEALVDMRGAMTRITKDVRQAIEIRPGSTRTRLDIRTLSGDDEFDVVYEVDVAARVLTRSVGGNEVVLVDRIINTEPFCYQYDQDLDTCLEDSPPETMTALRVELSLTPIRFEKGSISLETDVQLRNF